MATQAMLDTRSGDRTTALGMSTLAFTVCFAVWTIFSIIGVQIKKDLGLNDTQFGLLVGTPILTGSLIRLILGIWTDQYGGRIVYVGVMLAAAVGDLAAHLRLRLSDLPAGGARRRHRRRLVRGRHRLCVALVRGGQAGHRARHLRRRQCRRRRHQVRGALRHGRVGLEERRQDLGRRARRHGASCSGSPPRTIPQLAARRKAGIKPRADRRPCSSRCRTSRSGASRSTTSSCSAASWRWRCGCRAT